MSSEKLITNYLPLVRKIASQYKDYGMPYEDLVQEGLIGLIEAESSYREEENTAFGVYATFWIKKYILAALDKETNTSFNAVEIHDNYSKQDDSHIVDVEEPGPNPDDIFPPDFPILEKQVLVASYFHSRTLQDIAEQLGFTREKVRQIKTKALRRVRALNLVLPKD